MPKEELMKLCFRWSTLKYRWNYWNIPFVSFFNKFSVMFKFSFRLDLLIRYTIQILLWKDQSGSCVGIRSVRTHLRRWCLLKLLIPFHFSDQSILYFRRPTRLIKLTRRIGRYLIFQSDRYGVVILFNKATREKMLYVFLATVGRTRFPEIKFLWRKN